MTKLPLPYEPGSYLGINFLCFGSETLIISISNNKAILHLEFIFYPFALLIKNNLKSRIKDNYCIFDKMNALQCENASSHRSN